MSSLVQLPPSASRQCRCVKNHSPRPDMLHEHHIWPLGMGGPDTKVNRVWLCPTAHANVHEYIRVLVKREGVWVPPMSFGRANPYLMSLARKGYEDWVNAGKP